MSRTHKRRFQVYAGILCFLLLFSYAPQKALAAGLIEPGRSVTLTLNYKRPDKPFSGVSFSLYRVATISSTAQLALTGSFRNYSVSLQGLDSAGWRALANTLAGFVARDGIAATDSGQTNASGVLRFPAQHTVMATGLYLVIGQKSTEGQYTYTPEPFLICLPNRTADDRWVYDVTAAPKYDSTYIPDNIDLKALKIWKDDGYESKRPTEVVVQLLRDGVLYQTVTLNAGNSWRYTWTALDASYTWQAVEKTMPAGYTVSVVREGGTFAITNTFCSGGGSSGGGGKAPQTGVLWWPVPMLSGAGMLILMIGWVERRKQSWLDDE